MHLTRSTLLLNNPAADPRFGQKAYVQQRQPQSVPCLPVHTQGKLVALVYLENNLIESAFTSQLQQTLELVSSQACRESVCIASLPVAQPALQSTELFS